jgi:Rrf2 family protein
MAMADIVKHGADGAVSLSAIAERQQLSQAYLEQLFQRLRKVGLVTSSRGRSGGYELARPAGEISVAEIMQAVEEPTRMTRCDGGQFGCVGGEKCLTHELWSALGDHIAGFLSGITLAAVIDGLPGRPPKRSASEWTARFGHPSS